MWTVIGRFVDDQGMRKAECTICKKVLASNSKKNGTSSSSYHVTSCQCKLDAKLSTTASEGKQVTLSFQPSSSEISSSKVCIFNQGACVVALAKMIIIDELPFGFVEHAGFIRFVVVCCRSLGFLVGKL
ncbi:Zinc finger BED domain-containing protein RICESLEEPER 3 [Linum perenne]